MLTDLNACRRFFAEDIQICSNLRSDALVEALAAVPRERFLPPGPWLIKSDADFQGPPRRTPGDDPRFVYHNVGVALDPSRMLFNGAPGLVCTAIDALMLEAGQRALHIGGGTGYYTALMAHVVGSLGSVSMVEVDEALARQAGGNLGNMPWVTVQHGDARTVTGGPFNAILVNAGVTHPESSWLAALAPGGRLVLPLTASFGLPASAAVPALANISKGLIVMIAREGDSDAFSARLVTFVAIFSAVGLRDAAANEQLGRALKGMPFPALRRFRVDTHAADATCWCHTSKGCWSMSECHT